MTIVWKPSPEVVERANVTRFMRAHGIDTEEELIRRSTQDVEWFWDAVVRDLGLEFYEPYTSVLDASRGIEWATWFGGGSVNLAHVCVDRWAERSPDATAVSWEGEEGSTRSLSYRELREQADRLANGLRAMGVRSRNSVGIFLPPCPEAVVAVIDLLASLTRADLNPPLPFIKPRALPNAPAVKTSDGRGVNHAKPRRAIFDKADVDCVVVSPADELFRPIQWIDQEIGIVMGRNAPRRDLFLSDHRDAGSSRFERTENDLLRRPVANGYGRLVALGLDLETRPDQPQNLRSRRPGGDDQGFEELFVVDQRGAIRIPPSRRMLSALR